MEGVVLAAVVGNDESRIGSALFNNRMPLANDIFDVVAFVVGGENKVDGRHGQGLIKGFSEDGQWPRPLFLEGA